MFQIDVIDRKLLELLQLNSNRGIKELAFEVGLTATPVYERIKRLEKTGIIKKYSIEINREKVGLELMVFCQVSLQTHSKTLIERFETAVKQMTEVAEVFHISGEFDYLLKVVCHDNKQYHDFLIHKLSKLEMVAKVQSNFVMYETKEFKYYPVP
jgi:DNA-binding Lrp family transcriptional regulator